MLKELRLTGGIGARIARNILYASTKDALEDQIMTFVTSANQKKTSKIAKHRELTPQLHSAGSMACL
jgi:hypothetical protein